MLTGATVAFFAYDGFDVVSNSAEESKRPQHDLPIGIIGSLLVCVLLYIGVCLVITGMVPYQLLGEDAPLAEAFKFKGLNSLSVLISIGAIAGLTTTLLVGLYVQKLVDVNASRRVKQRVGLKSDMTYNVKPSSDGQSNIVTFNLTPEMIHQIFAEKPAVRQAYLNFVPNKMTERDFWTKYWRAQYLHSARNIVATAAEAAEVRSLQFS